MGTRMLITLMLAGGGGGTSSVPVLFPLAAGRGSRRHLKRSRRLAVRGSPVRTVVVVDRLACLESCAGPGGISRGRGALEEVGLERGLVPGTEIVEQGDVLRIEVSGLVGRNVEN